MPTSSPRSSAPFRATHFAWVAALVACSGARPVAREPATDGPAPSAPVPASPSSAPSAAPVDVGAALAAIATELGVPALAGAVVDSHRLLALGCAGVCRADVGETWPWAIDDAFHIGSCTKAMTATVLAMLVQDGVLRWDLSIGEAFADLADVRAEYRTATLAQLLTHRAGVPPYTQIEPADLQAILHLPGDATAQRRAFVHRVLAESAVAPGERPVYSNAGYTVAAAMAERATGRAFEDLLRNRLFAVLDMQTAGFGWPHRDGQLPRGHEWQDGRAVPCEPDDPYRLGPCLLPGGDVHCSVRDLAAFAQFHLSRGEAVPGLLGGDAFSPLHAGTGPASEREGMGWITLASGEAMLLHDGTAGTFYSRVLLLPERDRAVVVATNVGEPAGKLACDRAGAVLLDAVREPRREVGEPGPRHRLLQLLVGEWDATMRARFSPDGEFETLACACRVRPMLGGRFVAIEQSIAVPGMPIDGLQILGYDDLRHCFTATWFDSVSTWTIASTGVLRAPREIELRGSMVDGGTPAGRPFRTVVSLGEQRAEFTLYDTAGDREVLMSTVVLTRRPDDAGR